MWGLLFEALSLAYSLITSLLRFILPLNTLSSFLMLPVIFSANVLVFWVERGYFASYKLLFKRFISMNLLIAVACHVTFFYSFFMLVIKVNSSGISGVEHEF